MLPLSENALDELVALERERGAQPLTDWRSLSAELRAEGLIREPVSSSRFVSSRWVKVAAGLTLAIGGAGVGRFTAGTSPNPVAALVRPTVGSAVASSNASLASASAPFNFKSPDEAWETLNRAGEEYQRASAYLSATNTAMPLPADQSQYRTRLATLDNVMSEVRGALREAPQDPVINQYYLATMNARETTLREMGKTLPVSARLNRF